MNDLFFLLFGLSLFLTIAGFIFFLILKLCKQDTKIIKKIILVAFGVSIITCLLCVFVPDKETQNVENQEFTVDSEKEEDFESVENLTEKPRPTSTNTPTPKPTKKPTPKPKTPTYKKSDFDEDFNYEDVARYPEKYNGKKYVISGQVNQVVEGILGDNVLLFYVDGNNIYVNYDSSIIDYKILEDDYLTLYCEMRKEKTYTTVLGASVTIPQATAFIIELATEEDVESSKSEFVVDVTTPTSTPTPTPTPSPKSSDIEILSEYLYQSRWNAYHYIVVKNNFGSTIDVSTTSFAYDSDGNLISVDDASEEAIGSGCTSIIREVFDTEETVARVETEISGSVSEYYESVLQDLSYTKTEIKDGVIVQVTNNGSKSSEFVKAYVLFFDGDKLIYEDSTYFTDDDSEIKPQKTISKQINSYKDFDRVEIYLTGRRSNW